MKATFSRKTLRRMRLGVVTAILVIVVAGVATESDFGTLCSLCPFGFVQTSLASREFHAALLLPLVIVVAVAIVAGRAFCSWGCPSNLVKPSRKKRPNLESSPQSATASQNADGVGNATVRTDANASPASRKGVSPTLRNALIVASVLAASFVVGFPVFCLFCPIGLAFGFVFAMFRSLTVYQPSWDLVIFPAMLFIELRLLGSWCSRICPLGAAASLIARFSPLRLATKANPAVCHAESACRVCAEVCPERIGTSSITEGLHESCTLCLECSAACPHEALSVHRTANDRTAKQTQEGGPMANSSK